MGETPSTACCVSGFPVIHQQRVLLFGSVRCNDRSSLDSSFGRYFQSLDQGFGHGRAQMFKEHQKQQKLHKRSQQRSQKLNLELYQQNSYQENCSLEKDFLDDSNNYFTNLGGGTSSQTSDGRSFGRRDFGKHQALFGEGLYDETI